MGWAASRPAIALDPQASRAPSPLWRPLRNFIGRGDIGGSPTQLHQPMSPALWVPASVGNDGCAKVSYVDCRPCGLVVHCAATSSMPRRSGQRCGATARCWRQPGGESYGYERVRAQHGPGDHAVQRGRHPSAPSRRHRQGHRARPVRRRLHSRRPGPRGRPAKPARSRTHQVHRHEQGGGRSGASWPWSPPKTSRTSTPRLTAVVDLGESSIKLGHLRDNVLASRKALYKGQPIAAVAAANRPRGPGGAGPARGRLRGPAPRS